MAAIVTIMEPSVSAQPSQVIGVHQYPIDFGRNQYRSLIHFPSSLVISSQEREMSLTSTLPTSWGLDIPDRGLPGYDQTREAFLLRAYAPWIAR